MLKFILSLLLISAARGETFNVVVLGDSMEAGVFSGSAGIKSTEYIDREGSLIRKFILWAVENHGANWSTGSVDYSIVSRLESLGLTVNSFNSAISGATVETVVNSEIPSAKVWAKDKKIDLLLVFVGGNNTCSSRNEYMTDQQTFAFYYRDIANFAKIATTTVFVPLPDFTKLYEFKDRRCFLGFKCSKIWELTKNCINITRNQDLPAIRKRIAEYNEVIKNEANRIGAIYVDKADMLEFDHRHVSSIDGFHPSKEGQKLISDLVWEALNVRK